MDGAFKSYSKQFSQIHTIHVDLRNFEDCTNIIALVYALLPNKRFATFVKLFTALKQAISEWKLIFADVVSTGIKTSAEKYRLWNWFRSTKKIGTRTHITGRYR